jgi:sulfur carrier protein ThiS
MTTILRVLGPLQSYVGGQNELEIEPGHTVRETLTNLGILPESVALVSVDEEIQSKDYVIQEGDSIRIMAVIGGG